jgi:hypothetical protein
MPKTLCNENLRPEEARGSGIAPRKSQRENVMVAISTSHRYGILQTYLDFIKNRMTLHKQRIPRPRYSVLTGNAPVGVGDKATSHRPV